RGQEALRDGTQFITERREPADRGVEGQPIGHRRVLAVDLSDPSALLIHKRINRQRLPDSISFIEEFYAGAGHIRAERGSSCIEIEEMAEQPTIIPLLDPKDAVEADS